MLEKQNRKGDCMSYYDDEEERKKALYERIVGTDSGLQERKQALYEKITSNQPTTVAKQQYKDSLPKTTTGRLKLWANTVAPDYYNLLNQQEELRRKKDEEDRKRTSSYINSQEYKNSKALSELSKQKMRESGNSKFVNNNGKFQSTVKAESLTSSLRDMLAGRTNISKKEAQKIANQGEDAVKDKLRQSYIDTHKAENTKEINLPDGNTWHSNNVKEIKLPDGNVWHTNMPDEFNQNNSTSAKLWRNTQAILGNTYKSAETGVANFMDYSINVDNKIKDVYENTDNVFVKTALSSPRLLAENLKSDEQKVKEREAIDEFQDTLQFAKQQNAEIMQNNVEDTTNPVTRKVAELSESLGNNLLGAGLSAINPVLGTTYFIGSAGGSYYDEAIERGMNKDQALLYGTIMGTLEGVTEEVLAGKHVKAFKDILAGEGLKNTLGKMGIEIGENFLQEAVMPGLSELTAYGVAGKGAMNYDLKNPFSFLPKTAEGWWKLLQGDFSQIGDINASDYEGWRQLMQQSFKEGIDGGLSAGLMMGISRGVPSAIKLTTDISNGKKVNVNQISQVMQDCQNAGIDMKGIMGEEISYRIQQTMQNNQNLQQDTTKNQNSNLQQQITQAENKNGLNQNVEGQSETKFSKILNNKELPMKSYVYEKSDNVKIDNLRQQASKYFNNTQEAHNFVDMLEKIITDKNIEINLDTNLGEKINGQYKDGVITINPNSNRAGEFLAIHELTHAIGTDSMIKMVENYRKSNAEFDSQVKKLLQNYNQTEINEEALADIAGQLFGNQEYINNLAKTNPSMFKTIYNEIKYLWHQFTGYKNQDQFVDDLMFKWEQAYRNNNQLNETNRKSLVGESATLADKDKLKQAQKMEQSGMTADEIFKETGWYKGNEGKWRFELDDSNWNLKDIRKINPEGNTKLENILDAPELYRAYPELKELTVQFNPNLDKNNYGSLTTDMFTGEPRIVINSKLIDKTDPKSFEMLKLKNQPEIFSTLQHEIQHYIQNKEGFSSGASPAYWFNEKNKEYKEKIFNVFGDKSKILSKYGYDNGNKVYFDLRQLVIQKSIMHNTEVELTELKDTEANQQQIKNNKGIIESRKQWLEKDMKEIQSIVNEKDMLKLNKVLQEYDEFLKKGHIEASKLYLNTAGEQESRDVESRIKLTSEEKKNTLPFIKDKNTVYATDATDSYHVSEDFSNEIDKALQNKLPSNTQVKARDFTPDILVKNGVPDLPMLITQRHIKSIIYTLEEAQKLNLETKGINYHGLGKDLLIKAIDNMDSPKAIYKTGENDFLIITELKDKNNNGIVIPIQINGRGRYNNVFIDENQIKSVYGRNNLNNYIKKNDFEEIYKKEEPDFNERIQYPNVADSSSTNSITPSNENVNTTKYSMQESENNSANLPKTDNKGNMLSKEQQEYFKNSKVRDENGKLLEVYHGTNADFNIFDKSKIGANTYNEGLFGKGFYFTNSEGLADGYSKYKKGNANVKKVYLNIENPFVWKSIKTEEQMKQFIKDNNIPDGVLNWNRYQQEIHTITDIENERKFAEALKKTGYDGIIYEYRQQAENQKVVKEIVAFEPNQIKNIDNQNPTSNPDIRYSKSEDTSNKTLLAIHNLTEDKLKGILELGGFPVPSIAITNPDINSHEGFGNISVIFDKNTIDPESNKANKVYSRDAYTTRVPKVVNKIIEEGIKQVSKNTGIEEWNLKENYKEMTLEDAVEKLRQNENIMDKYLKDNNIKIDPVYKDFQGFTHLSQDSLQNFIKNHKELVDSSYTDKYSYSTYEKYYNDVHDLFINDLLKADNTITKKQAESLYKDYPGYNHWNYFIKDLDTVNNLQGRQQLDEVATKYAKENVIDTNSEQYKNYVKDLISPMYGEKYVRNNKDYYTNSGNPRSFSQRYDTYTLDNLVKIMNETKGTGQESSFGVGINEIAGDASKRFKSIQDIKNSENLLVTQNEEEHKQTIEKYNKQFRDLESSILNKYSDSSIDGYIWREKAIEDAIKNIARKKAAGKVVNTDTVIFQFKDNGIEINKNQAQKTINLIDNLSTLPTNYFEAKPQRAVGLDEVRAIVVPNNMNQELKQQLIDRGLNVVEYDANKEGDRQAKIKTLNEYKFSKNNGTWQEYLEKEFPAKGTRTNFKDINQGVLPTKENIQKYSVNEQSKTNLPIGKNVKDTTNQKTLKTDELNLPKSNKDLEEIRSSTIDKIVDKRGKPKSGFKEIAGYLNQKLINKGYYIDQLAKQTKNPELTYKSDRLLNAFSEAQYSIGQAQTDNNNNKVGKSLIDIFKPADDAKLSKEFDDYLLNRHNIDRKAVEKSIFGEAITAKDSQKTVAEYEAKHPEFKKWAEDVYKYNNNQLQSLVDAGFISKETQTMLNEMYGSYVPTYRNIIDTLEEIQDTNEGKVNGNPLKRAKGGSQEIISIREAMAEQTVAYKRALRMNEIGQELLKTLGKDKVLNDNVDIQYASPEAIYSLAGNVVEKTKGGNIFTVFKDGNAYELKINDELYSAFEPTLINKIAKNQKLSAVLNPIAKITQWHKNLLTTYSIGFSFNNPIKDFQDALINTKYSSAEFIKNYPRALKQIATKGEYYDSYKRNGGFANSYFDYEKGILPTKRNVAQKVFIDSIRNMNEVIEQAPRLAEYITTLEHGGTVNEAMYNASEVTINFKRGGDVTKAMNKYGAEFLNASVQGMDKIYRNITGQNGFKGYASLLAKAVVYNVAPAVLNHLLLRDDDDYEELSDYNKNNYFLFKLGDGKFLRIPKGRVSSVMGTIAREMLEAGEGKGLDIKNIKDTAINQVAPNNPLTDNIISPLMAVKDNKAWYGGKIVKDSLAKLPEGEQYDETTDIISKYVGGKTNISPKKINYLLDQYSGGIGDVILPMLTPQAENNIIEDKFTTDSVIKNKYPSEFYETIDELEKKKNSLGATEEDVLKYKYLSSVSSDLADLYKEKHEIQNSTKSDKEKKELVREVQDKINKKTKEALENAENAKITSTTAEIGNKEYYNYKGEWTKLTDKEKEKNENISLKTYADYKNKVAEKANGDTVKNEDRISVILDSNYSKKEKEALYENYVSDDTYSTVMKYSGINIDEYLKYKQQKFEADKVDDGTEKGKSVSGSKKQKVYNYVNNMNVTGKQRMLLLGTQYKLTDSERRTLANYVNDLNITRNQKIDIYKKLQGFTVYKDGRVTF